MNNDEYIKNILSTVDNKERQFIRELVSGDNFDKLSRKEQLDIFKKATLESK